VTLTAADVAEIMRLVEQSGFDELRLEIEGVKLHLRRGGADSGATATSPNAYGTTASAADDASGGNVASAGNVASGGAVAAGGSIGATPAQAAGVAVASGDPNIQDVASPLLGSFYRAPKPGAPPFVEVGAQVEENTVVAIIEVMKLMNTVRAGVKGTVTEILLADGALAEYGQPLMRIRKAG
jgi:acetyl-CoA carboxylase biotin carboxyl carrier protein